MFYDKLKDACNAKGITPTALVRNLGMSKGNLTSWRNGGIPSADVLIRISENLDASVDFLLENEQKETPAADKGNERVKHDKLVEEAIRLMDSLSPSNRKTALRVLDALLESQQNGADKSK